MHRHHSMLVSLAFLLTSSGIAPAESNWPRWRGPRADGHTAERGLPAAWDSGSVTWQVPLPGRGHSSPIVWGERIFLTAALEEGKLRVVFCVDRTAGDIVWQQIAWRGDPEPTHDVNGHASATCTTDGRFVYAFFGRAGGLHCYTVDGKQVWSRDLGSFAGDWGTAASPILVGDLVVQNCDADEDARIVALEQRTGAIVWSTRRDDHRGWSTPIVIDESGREAIVVNGHSGVRAYAPDSGKELWYCKSFIGRGTPTVTPGDGLVHVVNGLRGDVYAIRPGGSGDVTGTHMAWHTPRRSRDIASPIVVGGYVLVMSLRGGILACYDTRSGEQLWMSRTGAEENFSASPISYDGLALFTSESGETLVVKPGPQLEIVSRNSLGSPGAGIFRASITPSDGELFVRSDRMLFCIGTRRRARP